jgi:hypothetical protein
VKKTLPTDKILIVLMFWAGDKAQAMKLARLLADLEPGHSEKADFLFVSRFDCTHDDETARYVSRKFNVFKHTSKRRGTGWPLGCNSIFFGALEFVYHKLANGLIPHYKAVLFLGADGAPLRANWIDIFHEAWNKSKPYVAGAMILDPTGGHDHINGDCALLSGDLNFLKWLAVTVGDVSTVAGWDWVLSAEFNRWGWVDFPFVRSVWRAPMPMTEEIWNDEAARGTVWYHGIKDYSLLALSRKNLL